MNNKKREFLEILREMKGKSFVYAEKTYLIKDYSIDEARERVTIATDKRTFERNYDSVGEFLTYFQPVTVIEAEPETNFVERAVVVANKEEVQTTNVYEEHASLAKDLIGILKDNIDKVKKDKSYIAQAQAINNNVNSIINVTKLQLDVFKQFKGKKVS